MIGRHSDDPRDVYGDAKPLAGEPLPLFDPRKAWRPVPPLERAFLDFHAANPAVLDLIIHRAREIKASGRTKHVGLAWLVEDLRYDRDLETKGAAFKIPNAHRAFYARLAMHRAPDIAGFFETRGGAGDFDPADAKP